jgi:aconitate hydratase
MFVKDYANVFEGDERWKSLDVATGDSFAWDDASTYVRRQTFFDGLSHEPAPVVDVQGARVLALLGDSVTTDHISPAGAIKSSSPAGLYLQDHGIGVRDFNSYGSRRGNHEVMVRGTFGNIRLRNLLLTSVGEKQLAGGFTYDLLDEKPTTIFEASQNYRAHGVPLVILAGKEYGTGSSRDWAAKGTAMLGVKAVIARSFERIHRSNLIGMGVLPLQFPEGESAESLGLNGTETFSITGMEQLNDESTIPSTLSVTATAPDGGSTHFDAVVRIDTPGEADYFRNGGILQYVLRGLMKA